MLANILKSPVAVRARIQVVRAVVHLRQLIATNDELVRPRRYDVEITVLSDRPARRPPCRLANSGYPRFSEIAPRRRAPDGCTARARRGCRYRARRRRARARLRVWKQDGIARAPRG